MRSAERKQRSKRPNKAAAPGGTGPSHEPEVSAMNVGFLLTDLVHLFARRFTVQEAHGDGDRRHAGDGARTARRRSAPFGQSPLYPDGWSTGGSVQEMDIVLARRYEDEPAMRDEFLRTLRGR
jgi:hypothetical protein